MDKIIADNLVYMVGDSVILDHLGPFSISQKDLVCINGPSGGGKTTFLNSLAGLVIPNTGSIHWGKTNILDLSKKINIDRLRMSWISIIFQEPRLAKNLTGWENIFLPMKISGSIKNYDRELLDLLLDTLFLGQGMSIVELDAKLHQRVSNYSGGQMQRIAIIRAIMTLPKFIFADEILNSVEPELQEKTWDIIKKICKDRNIGFLLVTHNVSLLSDVDFTQNIKIENGAII